MNDQRAAKPLPEPTPVSRPYWEAARRHRLAIPRCGRCGHRFFYPRSTCPRCLGDTIEWEEESGRGTLYSFTVIRQATTPGFAEDVPYVLGLVALDGIDGVYLPTNVVGCEIEEVEIGMPLEVVFDDVSEEISLPKFRPA